MNTAFSVRFIYNWPVPNTVVERLTRDARYSLRALARAPVFAAVATVSLALGIGANAAIFQLIDTVRFRSLPVADPDQLVEVRADGVSGFGVSTNFNAEVTNPLWEQMRTHQSAFAAMFAWGDAPLLVGRADEARQALGLWVSGDFFRVLGITPERGRLLTTDDDRRGCGSGAAIVSHAFWQANLGGRENAVGSVLTILDHPFTVVGVTPASFRGLEVGQSFDVALPLCSAALWGENLDRRDLWWLTVMGRLKPDWTIARANEHMRALSPALLDSTVPSGYSSELIARYRGFRFGVIPAGRGVSRLRGTYGTSLTLLFALTGLVLLMTCANLATLTLARASAREREIAVRVAIGAPRSQVVSSLLIESGLVALAGAVLAVPVALVSGRALVSFLDTSASPIALHLTLDWRLMAFVTAVTGVTAALSGLIPALRVSHVDPIMVMRQSSRGLSVDRHRARLQRGLVVGQIAISLALVVSALLFVRSFRNLTRVETGLALEGTVVVWGVDRQAGNLSLDQRVAFQQRLTDEIKLVPGVVSAASTTFLPLSGGSWFHFFRVPSLAGHEQQAARFTYVSPGYFNTFAIPILSGRDFQSSDTARTQRVLVVNQQFVRTHLGNLTPIGVSIRTIAEAGYPETTYEIIGVVGDTKYADLREEMPPIAYVPIAQDPGLEPWAPVIVKANIPLGTLTPAIAQRVNQLRPALRLQFINLKSQVRDRLSAERATAWLAGAFGVLAIVIVTVGLYGIIAYIVVSRTQEIGIRLSLGSTRAQIVTLVLRDSFWLLALGLIVGVPVTVLGMRTAGTLLFGLSPTDVATMAAASSLLAAAAALASTIPAWRAARVDPQVALRCE
jgi:putative ABC transport system permease protein